MLFQDTDGFFLRKISISSFLSSLFLFSSQICAAVLNTRSLSYTEFRDILGCSYSSGCSQWRRRCLMRFVVLDALADDPPWATSFAHMLQTADPSSLIDIWLNCQTGDDIVLLLCLNLDAHTSVISAHTVIHKNLYLRSVRLKSANRVIKTISWFKSAVDRLEYL